MQQERLLRDVQVQSTVFVELKKQYELAKLEEIKNITIVNVLDPGRVPVKKERPKRGKNSALAFMLILSLASFYNVYRFWYAARMKDFYHSLQHSIVGKQ
jgi:uncharacterized protein involved in exopolysaccharide biosynthesis